MDDLQIDAINMFDYCILWFYLHCIASLYCVLQSYVFCLLQYLAIQP